MGKVLTQEKLQQVKQLLNDASAASLTYREIARAVGLNYQTISILSVAWNLRRSRGRRKKPVEGTTGG